MIKPKEESFNVLSPDGFPITPEPFSSEKAARDFIPEWCKRFEHQGYYSTADREQIPLKELPDHLQVVSAGLEDKSPEADKLQKLGERVQRSIDAMQPTDEVRRERLRGYVREEWEKEKQAERDRAAEDREPSKAKEREPQEPDRDER